MIHAGEAATNVAVSPCIICDGPCTHLPPDTLGVDFDPDSPYWVARRKPMSKKKAEGRVYINSQLRYIEGDELEKGAFEGLELVREKGDVKYYVTASEPTPTTEKKTTARKKTTSRKTTEKQAAETADTPESEQR